MENHLVIIGKDSSAIKLSKMAKINDIKHVSVIFDPLVSKEKIENGEAAVYGDAVNIPILMKAHVDTADIVVISVGSLIPSMSIVEKVRQLNKKAYILVRVKHIQDVEDFYKLGADQVLPEKLEVAIDLFNRVLVKRLYPQREVNRMLNHIRSMSLGEFSKKDTVNKPSLLDDLPNLNITALKIDANSLADGKLLSDIELRKRTGVTLLAIKRGNEIIEHPSPDVVFQSNDILYVLGNHEQTNSAFELFFKEI